MGSPRDTLVHEETGERRVRGTKKEDSLGGIRTEGKVESERGDGRDRIERDHTSEVRQGEDET